jgi:hypothetical protein
MLFPLVAYIGYLLNYTQSIPVIFSANKGHMSTKILWQICHKKEFRNGDLTRYLVKMLRERGVTTKQAARDLDMPVERTRNWYYKDTGMTALDLLRIMQEYEFVRKAIEGSLPLKCG